MAQKTKIYLLSSLLILLFLLTRFYKINSSLFFFNDMGRDAYTLLGWYKTGKPPLLGPQTSALPINQSAIYFYMLYPSFILSHQSPFFALYTNAFLYIVSFIFCLYLAKKHAKLQNNIFVIFLLITIHPQYIIQNRYIWNPSFVTPFLLISFTAFFLFIQNKYSSMLLLTIFGLSMAICLSYSITPVMFALLIYLLIFQRIYFLKALFYSFLFLFLLNLPTLVFELRHNFLITSMLFNRGVTNQEGINLTGKVINIISHSVSTSNLYINIIIFLSIFFTKKSIYKTIFILSLALYLIAPIKPQAHYIFGLTTLIFFIISTQTKFVKFIYILVFLFFYIRPNTLAAYFTPAPRTYQQMLTCYQSFCQNHSQPLFVSVNSTYHPYHNGPEHRYLLSISGCDIVDIENFPNQTDYMAVISDGGTYQHSQTSYHELTMFGPSLQIENIVCQPNLSIYLLKKQ